MERLSQPKLGPAGSGSTVVAKQRGNGSSDYYGYGSYAAYSDAVQNRGATAGGTGGSATMTDDGSLGEVGGNTVRIRRDNTVAPAGETNDERIARLRAGVGGTPVKAAPDLTDELLQQSASSTVARLRRGMGRRSTFLDSAVGDSTLLGGL